MNVDAVRVAQGFLQGGVQVASLVWTSRPWSQVSMLRLTAPQPTTHAVAMSLTSEFVQSGVQLAGLA